MIEIIIVSGVWALVVFFALGVNEKERDRLVERVKDLEAQADIAENESIDYANEIEKLMELLDKCRNHWDRGRCWCTIGERGSDEDYKEIHTYTCIRIKQELGEWTEEDKKWYAVFFEEVADGRDPESPWPISTSPIPLYRRAGSMKRPRFEK